MIFEAEISENKKVNVRFILLWRSVRITKVLMD